MKRRSFLAGASVAGLAAASLATPAIAQGKRELKLVTTWPKNFPGLGTAAQRLADNITAMTDGQLTIKLFAAGELVPPFQSFDAVSSGTADMYHGAEYYWQGKSKAFNFFAAVPYGMTADELHAWIYWGGGQEVWDKVAAPFKIKAFLSGNTGVQMGGWFNKEINNIEDLKGLKFRMPGLGGEVMRRIGVAIVNLPGGEIFPALQSGAIDGTEWVGPWNDLAFGFYKVAKFYYYPGFHEPGTSNSLGINTDVWDSFTATQKTIVQTACMAEANRSLAEFNAKNGDALQTLLTKHGVKLKKFSDDVLKALGEASGEVMAETGAGDAATKEVYESFLASRKNSIGWSKLAEESYFAARRLNFKYG
jgi:TRAP-type mannitol/chloroaromatic compound transport system substrate-binding protein